MILLKKNKFYYTFFIIIGLTLCAFKVFAFFSDAARTVDFENSAKLIALDDNGSNFKLSTTAKTVSELLEENKMILGEHDKITPDKDTRLYSGTHIEIRRAVKIKITADGKTNDTYALGRTVREALTENGIALSRLDKTIPEIDSLLQNNLLITVTRINIEEITRAEDVAFKTAVQNDAKLGWQEKKITTTGQLGKKEVRYRITYKNGKEISRVMLDSKITQEPVTQIETHGTYMQLGKAATGQGTWYSYQGGLFAASTTIPKGAFAKVTNIQNGKSVVVQINDYGPQGKGRVIDLDKIAFAKIASLGAGVIGVKVEPILN
ncbi:MAG: G5 domain-containing protein [Parcubacteria group bacterium]